MRSSINIKPYEQREILDKYPNLRGRILHYLGDDKNHRYGNMRLSVFDHCLSIDEANELLAKDHHLHPSFYEKMFRFFEFLDNNYEVYLLKRKGRYKEKFVFKRIIDQKKILTPHHFMVSSKHRFELVIPNLEMIVYEGCDFTSLVSAPESNMKLIASQAGPYQIYDIDPIDLA